MQIDNGESSGQGSSQDFELNLAPIIDCMVVLIAFLMISLSYLSIEMIDAGVSAPGRGTQQGTSQEVVEVKVLNQGQGVVLKHWNKAVGSVRLENISTISTWFKENSVNPNQSVLIEAEDGVSFELVVQVMDQTRPYAKSLQLSGF